MKRDSTQSWGKRALDVSLACVALGLAWPVVLGVALLVRWKLGRPVLFRQERPGLGGEIFRLYKFRTMSDARNAQGELLPDRDRLTNLGRRLRATSLDELPSLLNIIRGEMSLVGPRPLLVRYLERYSQEQARRHWAKPGLTGWAQVNGRNAVSWDEKFRLDVWYVDHWSFSLDLKIIWLTVVRVLRRDGITAQGHASMPEFEGSDSGARRE